MIKPNNNNQVNLQEGKEVLLQQKKKILKNNARDILPLENVY